MTQIVKTLLGSHLYGLDTQNSDKDYKSVYLPSIQDVILNTYKDTLNFSSNPGESKNGSGDIDTEVFSIFKYTKLLLQGQPMALDMLFSPDQFILQKSEIWNELVRRKEHWLHKDIYPYIGYARKQAAKYGIKGSRVANARTVKNFFDSCIETKRLSDYWTTIEKLANELEHCALEAVISRNSGESEVVFVCCDKKYQKNLKIRYAREYATKLFDEYGSRALQAEKNENIDWKAMSHAIRVADEAIELLNTHEIQFPLKNREVILDIKLGNVDFKLVSKIIEDRFSELEDAQKNSTLPEKPNWDERSNFLLELYGHPLETNFDNYPLQDPSIDLY